MTDKLNYPTNTTKSPCPQVKVTLKKGNVMVSVKTDKITAEEIISKQISRENRQNAKRQIR